MTLQTDVRADGRPDGVLKTGGDNYFLWATLSEKVSLSMPRFRFILHMYKVSSQHLLSIDTFYDSVSGQ